MEKSPIDQMRADAQVQIEQQDEQNFQRFCSFVDELEAHDSSKIFEQLAEIERQDNLNKYGKAVFKHMVNIGEIKINDK